MGTSNTTQTEHSWALPDAIIDVESLPSLPAAAVEVLQLTRDPDSSIEDLARAIAQDPALATKMLRLANSARFNVGEEITTLERAAMMLGLNTVRLMSLSFSLAASLPREGRGFDYPGYWRRSLVAAVAARSLAERTGGRRTEEAFLCGLLSHLGQLVLARSASELYTLVIDAAGDRWPTAELERGVLGFPHSDIGAAVLQRWGLPSLITEGVAFAFRPADLPAGAPQNLVTLCKRLAVAGEVVELTCNDTQGPGLRRVHRAAGAHLGLDEATVDEYLDSLQEAVREAASSLDIDMTEGADHGTILEQARQQVLDLSLSASAELSAAERRATRLEEDNVELNARAYTDALTGLPNRAAFDATLEKAVQERVNSELPRSLGLLLIDIDHFKAINDNHGHQAGDAVLRAVGAALQDGTRAADRPMRYGGEEFAFVVPHTAPDRLRVMAERIKERVTDTWVEWQGQTLDVRASIGGACLARAQDASAAQTLIAQADAQLYEAKRRGRDRVEILDEVLEGPMRPD